jgi:hypothetical protein
MIGFWRGFAILVCFAVAQADGARPVLTPPVRQVDWTGGRVAIPSGIVAETAEERQAGRVLAAELRRLHGVQVAPGKTGIALALEGTARGKQLLARLPGAAAFRAASSEEAYLLQADASGVSIVARRPRGLLFGVQTLLQLVRDRAVTAARIVDYPQLGFRGVHICIFPNTELASVRQAILVAARYKYNAVVLEPWASLKSAKHPETAYEGAYTPAQIRELVDLGRSLGLEMIPMLNSWGHASGMRARSGVHVVLERFPQFRPLYEEDGWSFCLTNPDVKKHLFDRFGELMELFGNPRMFHVGLDEAWGHRGLMTSDSCRGENPRATLAAHLKAICGYFTERKVQVIAWHDMFIERNHPQLGRLSPANSVPPFNSHLVLDELPKDLIIDAWNYDQIAEWPVPKYFHDRGFPVLVSPWKSRGNTVMLLNAAKRLNAMGLLETTWDSLDVSLPSVGEAGILAWTAPGFKLEDVPFQELLGAVKQFPITQLPKMEDTLRVR